MKSVNLNRSSCLVMRMACSEQGLGLCAPISPDMRPTMSVMSNNQEQSADLSFTTFSFPCCQ